ncbi:MAG TPA: two-component sensor histidine kinase [Alphaproteobacteria bacterium]|nr:two-component sensor histidine kinase [Alphaproteobacteria bacterium]HAJ46193.1 two-component sensor histidine kinase [Alphaproteobacteria bacterium]
MFVWRFSNHLHVRLRTLNFWRWLGVSGQLLAIMIVYLGLDFQLPAGWCFFFIALSAVFNLILLWSYPQSALLGEREAVAFLSFDVLQLTALLMLTGGIENPFTLLYLAPVVICAANLSFFATAIMVALSLACIILITLVHEPLPWFESKPLVLPSLYVAGSFTSLVLGLGFTTVYTWRTAYEARSLQAALAATQEVLAKEQRLSELGALAAATAHELGTPLGTITVVARELERDLPASSPLIEDVRLLRSQAERCRDILKRLSNQRTDDDDTANRLPLTALLEEIAAPHQGFGIEITFEPNTQTEPTVRRSLELVHCLGNVIENAVDYATARVSVAWSADPDTIGFTINDDGPGFDLGIIDRLGEPYLTTRAEGQLRSVDQPANAHAEGHVGMGLGIFITKTLVERAGGRFEAGNNPSGGAVVALTWPRALLERKPTRKLAEAPADPV